MKADLAIYSLIVGTSGQWVNVATMLNNKLDFYCCDNSVGFANPVTYYVYNLLISSWISIKFVSVLLLRMYALPGKLLSA